METNVNRDVVLMKGKVLGRNCQAKFNYSYMSPLCSLSLLHVRLCLSVCLSVCQSLSLYLYSHSPFFFKIDRKHRSAMKWVYQKTMAAIKFEII